MADRSDENKKEFSIEELNAWNVEKLQKYLKNRGVITTDTRKRDLVSKVYHACRLDLPLCSTKEQDDAQIKARWKKKLFIDGISLPLPEEMENWVSGSHNFPDMTMNDIELYLSKSNTGNLGKREKIGTKVDMSRKSSLTISQTVLNFVMYAEKLSRKQESGKIRKLCGFAWIVMAIYLLENVAVLPGMERAANMYLLYCII